MSLAASAVKEVAETARETAKETVEIVTETVKTVAAEISKVAENVKEATANAAVIARQTITDLSNAANSIKTAANTPDDELCVLYNVSRDEFKNAVLDEIKLTKQLDYAYSANRAVNHEAMTIAVHALTNWEYKKDCGDEYTQNLFDTVNEAIIEMCTAKNSMCLKGSCVPYSRVIEKINEVMRFNKIELLEGIAENAVDKYVYGEREAENGIRCPLKYMQSCVWDALVEGDIKMHGSVLREYGIKPKSNKLKKAANLQSYRPNKEEIGFY
ncbi:hypothetical protein AGMMS49975_27440 [Clostridia bacterium]|nr:hypothetical protein AGMMS49975_27440 [Clostridia bacterium]